MNDLLVTLINMGANLILEYLYDRCFVFGKTIKQPYFTHGRISDEEIVHD